jgi:hypothetical protein
VEVAITGTGDLGKELVISNVTSQAFVNESLLIAPMVDIHLDTPFQDAEITLPYDPEEVDDPANLSIFYFNGTMHTFLPVPSVVNQSAHTVTAEVDHFCINTVFHIPTWNAGFERKMVFVEEVPVPLSVMFGMSNDITMDTNDPDGYRKIAAGNFIDSLGETDKAGYYFYGYQYIEGGGGKTSRKESYGPISDLSSIKDAITAYEPYNNQSTHFYIWYVQDVNDAFHNDQMQNPKRVAIVLIDAPRCTSCYSDTTTFYYDEFTEANNDNISYYTIKLGTAPDATRLGWIAQETGGQYYYASSADQLPSIYQNISEICHPGSGIFMGNDTDGDGLNDTLELNGFIDGRHQWYYSNWTNSDTDDDGLTDGQEAGRLLEFDGNEYFAVLSDPQNDDSDGDGLSDYIEYYDDTDALDTDSDGEWLNDGDELDFQTDPWVVDSNENGYTDFEDFTLFFVDLSLTNTYPADIAQKDFMAGAIEGDMEQRRTAGRIISSEPL